jgi:carboxyl-terminal processing protease
MFHKGKLAVFLGSALIVLYGVSAAFYGKVVAKDEAYRELSVFMDALQKISSDYVEPPDLKKLQEGAMRGLVEALDPYSSFLSKEQADALKTRQAKGAAGIGVVLSKRTDLIYAVSVQHDGPADQAGIRPGDYVVAVDGTGTEDQSIPEVESMVRGPQGSSVKITVFRSSRSKPVDIEVSRKLDSPALVESRMLDGNIGLLEASSLSVPSMDQIRVKLKTLISAGAQKLLLDLRDCAEGKTSEGAELANLFVREGVLYYSQNRRGEKVEEVKANPEKFVSELPLVVLMNYSTAGAAEVAIGALKDHKRAVLVGDKSFGVGSSQTQIAMKSGALLIISNAKIYTPNGKIIQDETTRNTGIKPDIQSPGDERHQDLLVEAYYDEHEDSAKYRKLREKISKEQFDTAIEVLSKGQVPVKRAA